MKKIILNVILPKQRSREGRMRVEIEGTPVKEYSVLGYGNKGPGETSFVNEGNTPTGSYLASDIVDTSAWSPRKYGQHGALRLKAVSGNALLAEAFGRNGLLIHGGELGNSGRFSGKLRPTLGCLRMYNEDVKDLIQLLQTESGFDLYCSQPEIMVTIQEY